MLGTLPVFGLYVRHARDVSLRTVELIAREPDIRPAVVADDVTGLHVAHLTGCVATGEAPALWFNDVRGGLVEGDAVPDRAELFLRVTGENTERITLAGNATWFAESVPGSDEVAPPAVVHAMARSGSRDVERDARRRERKTTRPSGRRVR